MTPFTDQEIEKSYNHIYNLNEKDYENYFLNLNKEQEFLSQYLLEVADDYQDEEILNVTSFGFAVVFQTYLNRGIVFPAITEEMMVSTENRFYKDFDKYNAGKDTNGLERYLKNVIQQPMLIDFIYDLLEDEESDLDDETRSGLFVFFLLVVDLLNHLGLEYNKN